MKKILVCYDFSESSYQALKVATSWASKENGEILIAHVDDQFLDFSPYSSSLPSGYINQTKSFKSKLFEQRIEEFKEEFSHLNIQITGEFLYGNPVETILKSIDQMNIQIIFLGSRGSSALSKTLIGSFAREIITRAHIPVYCHKIDSPVKAINIFYCTDLTDDEVNSQYFLDFINKRFNPKFSVGHVVKLQTNLAQLEEIETDGKSLQLPKKLRLAQARAKEAICLISKKVNVNFVSTTIADSLFEFAGKKLLQMIDKNDPDLILLGSHSYNFWERMTLGSVSEYILNRTSKSVLIVPNKHEQVNKS